MKPSLYDESVLIHLNKSVSSAPAGQYKDSKVLCDWQRWVPEGLLIPTEEYFTERDIILFSIWGTHLASLATVYS